MADDNADNDNLTPTRTPITREALREAFRAQCNNALQAEARQYARKRVHMLRRAGRRVDSQYHKELVAEILADIWEGTVRWLPDEHSLLDCLRDVIKQRTFNEGRKGPDQHVSLQAANDQTRDRIEGEISAAYQSCRAVDAVLLTSLTEQVVRALVRLAADDLEASTMIACWDAGIIESAQVMECTGFSLARYRATRRRILYLAQGLPFQLRQSVQELLRRAS